MDVRSVIAVGRDLLEASREEYLAAAAEQLQRLLPSEDAFWLETNFEAGDFVAWRASVGGRDEATETAMGYLYEHPAIRSYLNDPADLAPRRLSDVPQPADLAGEQALRQSQDLMGPRQLSMIVDLTPPGRGSGWVLTRTGRAFRDTEVDTARCILPVLAIFNHLHGPNLTTEPTPPQEWGVLTTRERQVVELLTSGLTANAIGHLLGISGRTVSKHLENAYRKIGRHDRLVVAFAAAGAALVIPGPRPSPE